MALTGTFGCQAASITTGAGAGTALRIDGPVGARYLFLYVVTAAATVYAQRGPSIVEDDTDISGAGMPVPSSSWVKIPADPNEAPGLGGLTPAVYVQTDTNPTSIRYYWTAQED